MSNPSFENIDKWLFEYVEGNLSPAQVEKLELFMLNNPQFDADLDAWQMAKVDDTPVVFPGSTVRTVPSVPFWLISTLTLSAVFVSGMFFGSFLNNDADVSTEILSAAQVQDLNITAQIDQREIYSNSDLLTDPIATQNSVISNSLPLEPKFFTSAESNALLNNSLKKVKVNSADLVVMDALVDISIDLNEEKVQKPKDSNASQLIVKNQGQKENAITEENISNESEKLADAQIKEETESTDNSIDATARAMTRGTERISSNYNRTFSSFMKSSVRKIVRMTDNPIALTNSKDIYYHVPGMQTLNVNAATAGNLLQPRLQTTTRAQWTGQSNQQLMNELSFDTYARSVRGGIAIQMSHGYYGQGAYNVGQVALTYSPKFTVTRNFSIEPAIRFKMGDKRLNSKSLLPGQWIEMDRGNEKVFFTDTPEKPIKDLWYKDVALGLSSNTKWFSFGFQMDNIGRHFNNVYNSNEEIGRAGIHYTASLGTDFVSKSKIISLSPYLMYQKVENLSEIWAGSIFRYKKLTMGGGISSRGDYAGSIGWKSKTFMLTYQADMTQSNVFDTRFFSQQLTVRILMNNGRYGHTMLKQ